MADSPKIQTGYDDAKAFWYVVRWSDGTAARFIRRWQAKAAALGWHPPEGQAHRVPGELFRFEGPPTMGEHLAPNGKPIDGYPLQQA